MGILGFIPQTIVILWGVTVALFTMLVRLIFGFGVYRDAMHLDRSGRQTLFVTPVIWLFATLFGGVVVAGIYWAIHHSRLNASIQSGQKETDRNTEI